MADNDQPVTCGAKTKRFFKIHWRGLVTVLGPLVFSPLLIPPVKQYCWVAYTLCVMATYWVSEAIPLPVTAFLPLAIFPLSGVISGQDLSKLYCNDTVFIFMGSLMLASAIEQSGLHNRMALCAVRLIGYSHYKLLLAMSYMTMFASMWMTNTAATTMMVPINFALLRVFEDQGLLKTYDTTDQGELTASAFTTCYFCTATFSATIGGMGTLVGTGTNLVFKGLLESAFPDSPEYLSFPLFSAFGVPYMLVMETFLYFAMIIKFFGFLRPSSKAAQSAKISPEGVEAAKRAVEEQTANLGRLSYHEVGVMILFSLAIILFFARSPQMFPGWADILVEFYKEKNKKYIRDSCVAMGMSFVMWWFPSNMRAFKSCTVKQVNQLPKGRIKSVLDYHDMDPKLPWSFMFLLGGGFSISSAAGPKYSNLNGVIGDFLAKLSDLPNAVLVLVVIVFTVLLTNLASNIALATVIVPISMTIATRSGANPLMYNLAAGLSASYCFMLPVGTPGNLVAQSAAKIATKNMILAGIAPTVTAIFATWGFLFGWAPIIWPDLNRGPKDLAWATQKPSNTTKP